MIFILIKSPYSLAIYQKYLQFLTLIFPLESISPQPQALSARIDRWSNPKALISAVNNDSIQQERFPGTVFPSHRDNSNTLFDRRQESLGFLRDTELF